MRKDYYRILNVSKDATQDEIKKSYRKLVQKYHPDKTGNDKESEKKFKEVAEAYETLGNPEKRRTYDNPNPFGNGNPFGGNPFGGGFNPFAGGFNSPGFSEQDIIKKGKNINARVEITLEEVLNGSRKTANIFRRMQCNSCMGTGAENGELDTCYACGGIGVKRKVVNTNFGQISMDETCYSCSGSGKTAKSSCGSCGGQGTDRRQDRIEINIPKGSVSGISFTVPGKGDMAKSPSDPGDLIISVFDKPHDFYKRDGLNLICSVSMTFPEICLGSEVTIPNLAAGGEYKITIPGGTSPGKIFRLAGKGVPEFGNNFRGDILVRIEVSVPPNLSEEQKEFLEKYKEIF